MEPLKPTERRGDCWEKLMWAFRASAYECDGYRSTYRDEGMSPFLVGIFWFNPPRSGHDLDAPGIALWSSRSACVKAARARGLKGRAERVRVSVAPA